MKEEEKRMGKNRLQKLRQLIGQTWTFLRSPLSPYSNNIKLPFELE
jgi:hypothetical protein